MRLETLGTRLGEGGWVWEQEYKGVITYMSHVEVLINEKCARSLDVQLLDCLIVRSFSSGGLDRLIFSSSKVKLQPHILDPLIFQRSP